MTKTTGKSTRSCSRSGVERKHADVKISRCVNMPCGDDLRRSLLRHLYLASCIKITLLSHSTWRRCIEDGGHALCRSAGSLDFIVTSPYKLWQWLPTSSPNPPLSNHHSPEPICATLYHYQPLRKHKSATYTIVMSAQSVLRRPKPLLFVLEVVRSRWRGLAMRSNSL